MRLYRSAPGSHPAPVPRCRGGAARWKGVRPCRVPYPCRRVHRVPVRQRKALSGRLRATDSERARGGGSGTRARASLSGFRGMTGSRPAQRTVWTNPALWSATNQGNFFFSGQGPVGGAGILHGRRAVRAHFRTTARTRWAVLESGEKRSWRGEKSGCQGGTALVYVDRQGCRTGPWRKRLLSCLTCRKDHAGRGSPGRVQHQHFTASRHVPGRRITACLQQFRTVPSFAEKFVLIKRAGRGREFEGGGTFSRWQKVPPPSRKQPFLLRAGGIRASGH